MKLEGLKLTSRFRWIFKQAAIAVPAVIFIVFLNCSASLLNVGAALISKRMVDSAVSGESRNAVWAAVIFGLVIFLRIGINVGSLILSSKTDERLCNDIRQRIYCRITSARWLDASAYHSGDIVTRLTSDVSSVSALVVNTLPAVLALGVQFLASFSALFYYEPGLALLAFVLGPVTVLFSRHFSRKLKMIQIKLQESESACRSFIQESLQNLLVLKAFRQEERFKDQISRLHDSKMAWVAQKNRTSVFASAMLALGYWAGYFLAFGWGAARLGTKSITFGTLAAFLQLVEQVQAPFIGLSRALPGVVSSLASAERLLELENLKREEEGEEAAPLYEAGVRFYNLGFAYNGRRSVLKDIDIDIRPGDMVAVMGASGEGKTTLVKNLLALLTPHKGSIAFYSSQGTQRVLSRETRDYIAYVPQGNTLFSGTIEENIRFGKLDATVEEVKNVCVLAGALDFVLQLPDGLNTRIGERGIGISEGQAQRIALARAFLRKAPILVLDEATSSLDMETELHVLNSVKSLKCTCIVITHRPSALRVCSRIMVIKDGIIKELGLNDVVGA